LTTVEETFVVNQKYLGDSKLMQRGRADTASADWTKVGGSRGEARHGGVWRFGRNLEPLASTKRETLLRRQSNNKEIGEYSNDRRTI
jgi:hypothetical protein